MHSFIRRWLLFAFYRGTMNEDTFSFVPRPQSNGVLNRRTEIARRHLSDNNTTSASSSKTTKTEANNNESAERRKEKLTCFAPSRSAGRAASVRRVDGNWTKGICFPSSLSRVASEEHLISLRRRMFWVCVEIWDVFCSLFAAAAAAARRKVYKNRIRIYVPESTRLEPLARTSVSVSVCMWSDAFWPFDDCNFSAESEPTDRLLPYRPVDTRQRVTHIFFPVFFCAWAWEEERRCCANSWEDGANILYVETGADNVGELRRH